MIPFLPGALRWTSLHRPTFLRPCQLRPPNYQRPELRWESDYWMSGLQRWLHLPALLDPIQRLRWPATVTASVLPVSWSIRTSPRSGRSPSWNASDCHRSWKGVHVIYLRILWGGHREGALWVGRGHCTVRLILTGCGPSSTGTSGLVWSLYPANIWGLLS